MDKTKFLSCKFCKGPETRTIIGCCFSTVIDRKNIAKLSPLACINCNLHEDKNQKAAESQSSQI